MRGILVGSVVAAVVCSGQSGVCRVCAHPLPAAGVVRSCGGPLHRPAANVGHAQARGPGTELSRLLKRFGIEPTPTCSCRAKAAEMDAWGCDECSRPERIDEVVAVMRAEAKARGLPFLDAAGRLLVRRAIANARRLT